LYKGKLRVSAKSKPQSVAGVIANIMREQGYVEALRNWGWISESGCEGSL